MSEMVERAARAVDKAISLLKDPVWEDANESRKDLCRRAATAAIAAMREPTDAMVNAGRDMYPPDQDCIPVWETMIDEALR